jgi:spermidine/putrescine transport system ATP-binding protein
VTTPLLRFSAVTKTYAGAATPTLQPIDLSLEQGEFFSLIGPSGCGKTTTLKLVSGLEEPTSGRIELDGVDIVRMPMHKRPVHTVFQNYALFPHMTVRQNIAFGLKEAHVSAAEVPGLVDDAMAMVSLGGQGEKKPAALSGGMQQRVALARALVLRPKVLLLDEPLGALDLKLRHQMQVTLKQIQRETGVTFLYVTHDQEEAFSMSDRIGFMHAGRLVQVATPGEMYRNPASSLVADFVGASNRFDVTSGDGDSAVATDLFELPSALVRGTSGAVGTRTLIVRPETIRLAAGTPAVSGGVAGETQLGGTVVDLSFRGAHTAVTVRATNGAMIVAAIGDEQVVSSLSVGSSVSLSFRAADAWLCPIEEAA